MQQRQPYPLVFLLLLLSSGQVLLAQGLVQRNYSSLPTGSHLRLNAEIARLSDLVKTYFRSPDFQVLDVGLYNLSVSMIGEQSFDMAFQTAEAEIQGQAIPAAREPVLRSSFNLSAYLLMVWQVAPEGRSLRLRWKLRLPDNGTLPTGELEELQNILTSMGTQVAEQELQELGIDQWNEAQARGIKKIADLLEQRTQGKNVLEGEIYLRKISFKGFIAMDRNLNPTWVSEPGQDPQSPPICYVQGTSLVFLPVFACLTALDGKRVRFKIKTKQGESLPIDLTYDATLKTLQSGSSGIALQLDKTGARIESLEVSWLISLDASNEWQNVGISRHKLFVLYKKPPTYVSSWKSSLIYFGCTFGKGVIDNDAEFISAVWQPFEGKNLNLQLFKPDQAAIPFTYYRTPGQGCVEDIVDFPPVEVVNTTKVNGTEVKTKQLIIDGECGAFASLLESVLNSQGITNANTRTIVPVADKAFLVKNWEFIFKSEPNSNYPYQNKFSPNVMQGNDGRNDNTPRSSGNKYSQWAAGVKVAIRDLPGEAGQNIDNPYSDFENHKVVVINQEVLDPSYGKRFSGGLSKWALGSISGFIDVYSKQENSSYYLFKAREAINLETEIKFNN